MFIPLYDYENASVKSKFQVKELYFLFLTLVKSVFLLGLLI